MAGAVGVLVAGSAFAQGQQGTTGQSGTQSGQAGQAGQAGKTGTQAGQAGTQGGQAGQAGQSGRTGTQAGQSGQSGQQGQGNFSYRGFGQNPWFSDPAVRKQLNLNDEQYNKLNQAYGQAWNQFRTGSGTSTGNDQQSQDRMNQNWGHFNSSVHKTANEILDPQSRGRFNQLWNQYRGYDVFNDPETKQKLNLTDEQMQKFRQASQDYYTQQNQGGTGADAERRWSEGRRKMGENINSILNEQQRQTWREMTGEPYNFSSSFSQQGRQGQQGQSGNNNNQGQKNQDR